MATDVQTTEIVLQTAMNLIGGARWRLTLDMFLQRLDAPDNEYWREKFIQWARIAESLAQFDAHTLARLCVPEERASIRPPCGICGGLDGEHDWETHTMELHSRLDD